MVDRVGGEGWEVGFGAGGFTGGFVRADDCFSTTFTLFDPGLFPIVFAALESAFLPTADLFAGGCGGWVEDLRFGAARTGVKVSAATTSSRRLGAIPRVDRRGLWEGSSVRSSCHVTRLVLRVDLGVVVAEGSGVESSESASGAVAAPAAVLLATEASD